MKISLDTIESAAISAIHQERTVVIDADTLLEMVNTIRQYECQAAAQTPVPPRLSDESIESAP